MLYGNFVAKGYPGGKAVGIPFCVAKSLFATQRHFSELQEVLKNGDHHRAGHPSGFPAHTLPPRWRKALTLGQTQGIPAAKPPGYPFCVAKSLFATQRHFSELQEALKNGDHHRAGHPSGFPAHTLPSRWRKALTLGADSGYPDGKSRRDTLFFAVSPVCSAGGAIFTQNVTTYRNLRCEYCDLYSFFRRRTPRL